MKTHRNNRFGQDGRLGRWLCFPALVLICALATSLRADDNYEYFDPLTIPADTNGWHQFADYGPATFTITDGGYRLQSGPGDAFGSYPGPDGVGLTYADFQVSLDLIDWDRSPYPATLGNICIFARGSGLAAPVQNGYLFSLQPNDTNNDGMGILRITRIDQGVTAAEEAYLSLPINNTDGQYRLVFEGYGPLLIGRLFNLKDLAHPIATIQLTDSTYPSGAVGIAAFDGAAALELNPPVYLPVDLTVNNFQSGPPAPLLNISPAVTFCHGPTVRPACGPARADGKNVYFDPLTSPADTNGWNEFTDYGPATFTITNGGYRLQSGPGDSFGAYPGPYGVGLVYANFQVSVDVIGWDRSLYPTNLGNICIAARASGLAAPVQNGYLFSLQPNDTNNDGTGTIAILQVEAGETVEASSLSLPIDVSNGQYRLVFEGYGPQLRGSLFSLTDVAHPLATIQLTDTNDPSGGVGIAAFDGAAALSAAGILNPPLYLPVDFTVNNFQAGPPAPLPNIFPVVTFGRGPTAPTGRGNP